MKDLLFPFSKKFKSISSHWWHRVAIIIFALAVFCAGFFVWRSTLQAELKGYTDCYMLQMSMYDNLSSPVAKKEWQLGKEACLQNDQIHPLLDFGLGLFTSILAFYLLQSAYFKTIDFVVNGKPA
ncbi:MAG: hypothetical protein P4L61_03815, partial [Candidatus Pacebacteria bacterium]|nr:hypothetical protein [Candidatus Paceibacterota bacterium]